MQNRDYFYRPVQSEGRSAEGYGHTTLERVEIRDPWVVRHETLLTCLVIAIAVFLCGMLAA